MKTAQQEILEFKHKHCDGKIKYPDEKTAKRKAAVMGSRWKKAKERGKLNAYKCRLCSYWHIGHSRPK